jgi:nucleotide-binding universal stress UspA family protein
MHHKILVGLNSSTGSRRALEHALGYAAITGGRVVGLLVKSPLWKPPRFGQQSFESAMRVNTEALARQYGVPFEFRVRSGYPAHTIVAQARLLNCSLVVLGHADNSPFHRWLTASISELVRHDAPCRVVVIGTGPAIEIKDILESPTPIALAGMMRMG